MISFAQYTEMHFLRKQEALTINQIAQKMSLSSRTVAKWLSRERYQARRNKGRSGKLDPYKATIRSWLEKHPYSAQQIFQRLVEGGGLPRRLYHCQRIRAHGSSTPTESLPEPVLRPG